jgi:hypothetical protein
MPKPNKLVNKYSTYIINGVAVFGIALIGLLTWSLIAPELASKTKEGYSDKKGDKSKASGEKKLLFFSMEDGCGHCVKYRDGAWKNKVPDALPKGVKMVKVDVRKDVENDVWDKYSDKFVRTVPHIAVQVGNKEPKPFTGDRDDMTELVAFVKAQK